MSRRAGAARAQLTQQRLHVGPDRSAGHPLLHGVAPKTVSPRDARPLSSVGTPRCPAGRTRRTSLGAPCPPGAESAPLGNGPALALRHRASPSWLGQVVHGDPCAQHLRGYLPPHQPATVGAPAPRPSDCGTHRRRPDGGRRSPLPRAGLSSRRLEHDRPAAGHVRPLRVPAAGGVLRVGRRRDTPAALLAALVLLSGVLSALLVNDTVCVILAPLVVALVERSNLPIRPYLFTLAAGTNIGSVMTAVGNPQNMIVARA